MAGERQINWGQDETDATYITGDDGDGGNFIVAEDSDGATVLLQWNPTAGAWEYGGPVDMGSNDVTNIGSLDANAVSTADSITDPAGVEHTGELADADDVGGGSGGAFSQWRDVNVYDPGPSTEFSDASKDANNPVLTQGATGEWDENRVADPCIIRTNDEYKMYYTGRPGRAIGLATSTDLSSWSKDSNNPLLTPSSSGWDSSSVERPAVIKVGGKYYMTYSGWDGSGSVQIGLAYSDDGISWTKYGSNPLITPSSSGWDSSDVYSQGLFYDGGTLYIFYTAKGSADESIGYAYSNDGGETWTKASSNPVLTPSSSGWDSNNAHNPTVVKVGDYYHMTYSAKGSTSPDDGREQIGHAWSKDLDNWHKNPRNPIVTRSEDSADWDYDDASQGYLYIDGNTYEVFYAGDDASGDGTKIGRATIDVSNPSSATGPGLAILSSGGSVTEPTISTIIDDFEDNDIAEYGGTTAAFSTVTSPVKNGSYALEFSYSDAASMNSTSGLNAYPSEGDDFTYWVRHNSGNGNMQLWFATSSETPIPNNAYRLYLDPTNDNVRLENRGGGGWTISDSVTLSASTWYKFDVRWGSGGDFDVYLWDESGNQVASMSGVDSGTAHTSGGIAIYGTDGGTGNTTSGNFDNIGIV